MDNSVPNTNIKFMTRENPSNKKDKTIQELSLELDRMQEAYTEALGRLEQAPEFEELMVLTINERDPDEISKFLKQNTSRLSEEAKFFLMATIFVRKAVEQYRKFNTIK